MNVICMDLPVGLAHKFKTRLPGHAGIPHPLKGKKSLKGKNSLKGKTSTQTNLFYLKKLFNKKYETKAKKKRYWHLITVIYLWSRSTTNAQVYANHSTSTSINITVFPLKNHNRTTEYHSATAIICKSLQIIAILKFTPPLLNGNDVYRYELSKRIPFIVNNGASFFEKYFSVTECTRRRWLSLTTSLFWSIVIQAYFYD